MTAFRRARCRHRRPLHCSRLGPAAIRSGHAPLKWSLGYRLSCPLGSCRLPLAPQQSHHVVRTVRNRGSTGAVCRNRTDDLFITSGPPPGTGRSRRVRLPSWSGVLVLLERPCLRGNCYQNCYQNRAATGEGCAEPPEAGPLACPSICRCHAGGSRSRTPKAPHSGRRSLTARGTVITSAAQPGPDPGPRSFKPIALSLLASHG